MTDEERKQKNREKAARYRASPNNTIKLRYMMDRYGITPEEYESMEKNQSGLCAICGGPPAGRWSRLHVDHDHGTGEVRGLLCFSCNTLLGCAKDDPRILEKAIEYLAKAKVNPWRRLLGPE